MLWQRICQLSFLFIAVFNELILDDQHIKSIVEACKRNPHLPVCELNQNNTTYRIKRGSKEDKRRQQQLIDKAACEILVPDHRKICMGRTIQTLNESMKEFCEAFDNVCLHFQTDQPIKTKTSIQRISERRRSGHVQRNFSDFCADFKQRYLYVCPDPLRFGKKAVVFCPLYAEKCHVSLPEKPEAATRHPQILTARAAIARLCAENREFAINNCYNPVLLQQPNYRDACIKYRYFCTRLPKATRE